MSGNFVFTGFIFAVQAFCHFSKLPTWLLASLSFMSMSENKAAQFQLHGSRLTSTFATPRLPLEPIPPHPLLFFSSFSSSRIKVPLFQFALQPLSFTLCTPTCRKKLEFQVKGCDLKHLRFFFFFYFFCWGGEMNLFPETWIGNAWRSENSSSAFTLGALGLLHVAPLQPDINSCGFTY